MPNANASGYCRFSLGRQELANLTAQMGKLTDAEPLAYADAIDASFRHGGIDAGEVLAALKPLTTSNVRDEVTAPLRQVQWIYRQLAATDAQRAVLTQWLSDAYLPQPEQLGYTRKSGEPEDHSLLRSALAGSLGFVFKLPAVRAELLTQGEAAVKTRENGRLDLTAANPDLLGEALGVAVQERGKAVVDTRIAELPKTSDPA